MRNFRLIEACLKRLSHDFLAHGKAMVKLDMRIIFAVQMRLRSTQFDILQM